MDTETQILERALTGSAIEKAEADRLRALLDDIGLAPWFATVDDSAYALADWLRALLAFDSWLDAEGVAARPVESMLGYLECCTLTLADTLAPPDFPSLVIENLERHGFDAARSAGV